MANGQCGTLKRERSTSLSVKAEVSTVVKIFTGDPQSQIEYKVLLYEFDNLFYTYGLRWGMT